GLQVSGASFGLDLQYASSGNTYALDANGSIAVTGLPANSFSLSGTVDVLVNTTGAAVAATISNGVSAPLRLNFTDGSGGSADERNFAEVEGTLAVTVASFGSINGDFGFQTATDKSGNVEIVAGAQNVTAVLGTATTNLTISGV